MEGTDRTDAFHGGLPAVHLGRLLPLLRAGAARRAHPARRRVGQPARSNRNEHAFGAVLDAVSWPAPVSLRAVLLSSDDLYPVEGLTRQLTSASTAIRVLGCDCGVLHPSCPVETTAWRPLSLRAESNWVAVTLCKRQPGEANPRIGFAVPLPWTPPDFVGDSPASNCGSDGVSLTTCGG